MKLKVDNDVAALQVIDFSKVFTQAYPASSLAGWHCCALSRSKFSPVQECAESKHPRKNFELGTSHIIIDNRGVFLTSHCL